MKYGFGVDVGGTTVKLGLLSEAGELLEKWELPSRTENGGENILPDIARSVQDCMARRGLSRDDCLGLGIGVPGPVDASGMANRCVNHAHADKTRTLRNAPGDHPSCAHRQKRNGPGCPPTSPH